MLRYTRLSGSSPLSGKVPGSIFGADEDSGPEARWVADGASEIKYQVPFRLPI